MYTIIYHVSIFSKKLVDEHIEDTLCMHTICTADSEMHAYTHTVMHLATCKSKEVLHDIHIVCHVLP